MLTLNQGVRPSLTLLAKTTQITEWSSDIEDQIGGTTRHRLRCCIRRGSQRRGNYEAKPKCYINANSQLSGDTCRDAILRQSASSRSRRLRLVAHSATVLFLLKINL
jgi:hypothetical protein